jgi:outer membrane protein
MKSMKKTAMMLSLSGILVSGVAQADTLLGLYLGADVWRTSAEGSFANSAQLQNFNFNDNTQASYYLALEHPVPLLPNIRLQHNRLEADGNTNLTTSFNFAGQTYTGNTLVNNRVDLTNTDYVLYYEILDNDLVSLDVGINGKHFNGSVVVSRSASNGQQATQNVSEWVPMFYSSASIGLPLTGVDLFAQGSMVSYDGSRVYDIQGGVAYALLDNMALDMRLKVGYRAVNLRLDDIDDLYANMEFKGIFAGVELHF